MNRYQVFEAFPDGDNVQVQALNCHVSFIAAYWYYPMDKSNQLYLIDIKRQVSYTWLEVQRMMLMESLVRLRNGKRLDHRIIVALGTMQYIDGMGTITNKGQELLAELEPNPAIQLYLGRK